METILERQEVRHDMMMSLVPVCVLYTSMLSIIHIIGKGLFSHIFFYYYITIIASYTAGVKESFVFTFR